MTENTWRRCTSIPFLVNFVRASVLSPRSGYRKLRLFACACCRRVWPYLSKRNRLAVELAERFADGQAPAKELAAVRASLKGSANPVRAAHHACAPNAEIGTAVKLAALYAQLTAAQAVRRPGQTNLDPDCWAEQAVQVQLLRELVGNPFRPVSLDRAWLRWNDGTVVQLARKMYDDRDFSAMPVLADALVEAGCTHADILKHCRQRAEHVRGCWVVDLLLGKD